MTPVTEDLLFQLDNYTIRSLDDEIRADHCCRDLLKHFLTYTRQQLTKDPLNAGALARGADYFLRDYLIDFSRVNIFSATADHIRGFAGNWYIVSTLEPNMKQLKEILRGISCFYGFAEQHGLITPDQLALIEEACIELAYYAQRIDDFHQLQDNGFHSWDRDCPARV